MSASVADANGRGFNWSNTHRSGNRALRGWGLEKMIAAESDSSIRLRETGTALDPVLDEVLLGLTKTRKELPCKLFYDERGSVLFEQICTLDEYYLTRTEIAIMEQNASELAELMGPRCVLLEYGSGSSTKTRILLDHLHEPVAYIPIDYAAEQLQRSAAAIAASYPSLGVFPLNADYTQRVGLPSIAEEGARRVGFFPGSTIGNFRLTEAVRFLRRVWAIVGPGGGFLIGADLRKDPKVLHSAYNDASGVTAEFNLNILAHINRRFDADFRLDKFAHRAFYNERLGRIEMHLISREDQRVRLQDVEIAFRKGEGVLTEVSYKYSVEQFRTLARRASFEVRRVWMDAGQLFSVQYLLAC
ncbi:MAG TPA: L-histidine N(alpha)-methyltransferase [Anaerolineales bacterium]|nr:L-histidine N(alpha)-methyltransferase [Anaerolineales bacterium]